MKTIITLTLTLFAFLSYSQQQLEFNQVKLVSSEQTVPTDKVWKVESTLSAKSRDLVPYYIFINEDTVYVNDFIQGDKYWAGIASIEVDLRKTITTTGCTNNNIFYLDVLGFENDLPFSRSLSSGSISRDAASTSFQNVITLNPQTPMAQFELTSLRLRVSRRWFAHELKLTVNYINGTSQSHVYGGSTSTGCNSSPHTLYEIGDANGGYQIPNRSKETFFQKANFPYWLPEGTKLEAGQNVRAISVIEFNIL